MVFESTLYPPLTRHFQKDYLMAWEVPLASKKIDVVCARPKDSYFASNQLASGETNIPNTFQEIIAIEVKVEKWKKALRQALIYQLCAHKVYVALWYSYLKNVDFDCFARFGVGVIAVDGNARIVKESKQSPHVNPEYMSSIEKYFIEQKVRRG